MLDGDHRDRLVDDIQRAQVSALHRALDRAWMAGYEAGKQVATTNNSEPTAKRD